MPEFETAHPTDAPTLTRRTVVAGAGAAALGVTLVVAGCSTPSGSEAPSDSAGRSPSAGGPSETGAAGTTLGPATDVPVGSAKIYTDQGVVVTQATAGSYAGFSTVCPHQGCAINQVRGATIACPCHGSAFALDGSVTNGPATRGLTAKPVTVTGGQITLA
jgi:Rieske Fe-S protein